MKIHAQAGEFNLPEVRLTEHQVEFRIQRVGIPTASFTIVKWLAAFSTVFIATFTLIARGSIKEVSPADQTLLSMSHLCEFFLIGTRDADKSDRASIIHRL